VEVERHISWKTLLAYIAGTVDQELLLQNEYLATCFNTPLLQFGRTQHPLGLRHPPFAMPPFRLNRVQPQAFSPATSKATGKCLNTSAMASEGPSSWTLKVMGSPVKRLRQP
jgi:hypothetical protein